MYLLAIDPSMVNRSIWHKWTSLDITLKLLGFHDHYILNKSAMYTVRVPMYYLYRTRVNITFCTSLKADSHIACWAQAVPLPCRANGRRETACGLPARVRFLPAITRSSTKVVIRRIPISAAGGQCETKHRLSWTRKRVVAAHYKKDDLLHCWTSSSDISGYLADFHEGHGTIGAGQGRGMACVN